MIGMIWIDKKMKMNYKRLKDSLKTLGVSIKSTNMGEFRLDDDYKISLCYENWRIEGMLEYSDNGLVPGIHFDIMSRNDSCTDPYYISSDGIKYDYEDYSFYNITEINSYETLLKAIEEIKRYVDTEIKERNVVV